MGLVRERTPFVSVKKSTDIVKKVPFLGTFFIYQTMIYFLKKHFGKVYFPIGWTLVIAILLALPGSLLPNESKFKIPHFDKIVHIGLFGGFVFLWGLFLSNRVYSYRALLRLFFLVFVLANIYGIGMEYVQKYCIPLRDFDEADIIADMIGAGLAYGCCNLLLISPKCGVYKPEGAASKNIRE